MSNDQFDNAITDREMLRRLLGQEDQTMNNDDERDYEEEAYNAHLLDDERDPGDYDTSSLAKEDARNAWQHQDPDDDLFRPAEDPGTRTIVFRVPVRAGLGITSDQALADINRIIIRAWKRLAPMSDLAGPVTIIPEEAADLPDGRAVTRDRHRAEALRLADMAGRSDPEFVPGLGFAAVTRALPPGVALSAAASPEPEQGDTWRQRAEEAEAALTTIGGIVARPDYYADNLAEIIRILRTSGQQADRLTAPVAHTGMRAHDGLVPHSHEVRPDHEGVRRDLT